MVPFADRESRAPRFFFVLVVSVLAICCTPAFAQQPKVLAPHRPVPPRLTDSLPPANTYSPRYLRGGLWMTGADMKSSVYVRNDLEISSLPVTPALYLSNGLKLPLSPVTLEPSGTAVININDALASKGISPNATLSGYVELQYSWPWNALCATVSSVDATHSIIFTYGLTSMPPMPVRGSKPHSPGPSAGPQILEGAWWKQELGVTGFVSLSNTTDKPLPATVRVNDANANSLGDYQITVSPHGTKRVDLLELASVSNSLGGLEVTFNGAPDALIVSGGLEDSAKGYSASIPIGFPPPASAKAATLSYAEIGLMSGQADPMMHFPASTVLTPYSILRNLAAQHVTVTPVLYWMEGGAARSAQLASFPLGPLQTQKLDVPSLLALGGLKNFNGSVNLILEVQGPQDSVLLASGSVDNTSTYVFEVIPKAVKESGSKNLSYWSTANGDDTMVTLWNPADEPQDFQFKFLYSGGHYVLPVHLEARATRAFNVSDVIAAQSPDSEGNVIPLGVREGSAEISGPQAENELILVAMDAGTYNIRKATCAYRCINCNGAVSWALLTVPFAVPVAGSTQLTLQDTWNTGVHHDVTSGSTWNSSATSVATVSSGLVQGVGAGSVTIDGFAPNDPWAGQVCGSPTPPCPPDDGGDGSGPGNVKPTISGPNTVWYFSNLTVSGYATSVQLTSTGGASTTWTATAGASEINFSSYTGSTTTITSSGTAFSSRVGDVQVTATANGVTSDPFSLTTRTPYQLKQGTIQPTCDSYPGYVYFLNYTILDQLQAALPSPVPLNENWTTGTGPDYTGTNWKFPSPGFITTSATAPASFADAVSGDETENPPIPTMTCDGNSTPVEHIGQEWRIGTLATGIGRRVQTDTVQRYIGEAAHLSIVSPAP